MINIDFRYTSALETWSFQSDQFSFSRLRSCCGKVGQLPPAAADSGHLLSLNLGRLHLFRAGVNGRFVAQPAIETHGFFVPPAAPATLWVDQPFDILRFHLHRSQHHFRPALERLCGRRDDILYKLMSCFVAAIDHPATASLQMLNHVGHAIDHHLQHLSGELGGGARAGKLAPWQERRAKQWLTESLDGSLPIADIAARCGLTPGYFATAFKQSTGQTPSAWLMAQRIERAKLLLRDGLKPLQEVALECGFADQPHFTRHFSKLVGTSPGQWRALCANAA
jgi:AraC-like DNA-binding protein